MKLTKLEEVAAKFNCHIIPSSKGKMKELLVTDQRGVIHAHIAKDYKDVYVIQAWLDSPFPTELAIAIAEFAGEDPLFRMDMNVVWG